MGSADVGFIRRVQSCACFPGSQCDQTCIFPVFHLCRVPAGFLLHAGNVSASRQKCPAEPQISKGCS